MGGPGSGRRPSGKGKVPIGTSTRKTTVKGLKHTTALLRKMKTDKNSRNYWKGVRSEKRAYDKVKGR